MQNQTQAPSTENPIFIGTDDYSVLYEIAVTGQILKLAMDAVNVLASNALTGATTRTLDTEKARAVLRQAQMDTIAALTQLSDGVLSEPRARSH